MNEQIKTLAKHILAYGAPCCINAGFFLCSILYSNLMIQSVRDGADKDAVMDQFASLAARVQAAIMSGNRDEIARVVLEAGANYGDVIDGVDRETLSQYLEIVKEEMSKQKSGNET